MLPSMRRQAASRKKRCKELEQQSKNRQDAVELLQSESPPTIRAISSMTGVPSSTVGELKHILSNGNSEAIQKAVSLSTRAGRCTILTEDEEAMLVERMKFVAARGLALDVSSVKTMMARIAADGRAGWKNGSPSEDTVRAFRVRHRDITYRKLDNKEHAKLSAEGMEHVESFFSELEKIGKAHDGILSDGDRISNMDETAVDATDGKRVKVFSSARVHHGGFRGSSSSYGSDKHITAVVAVSASGRKTPPFFLVAGKRLLSNWFTPLHCPSATGICAKYTRPQWFPSDGVVKCTENGSMEKVFLPAFIKHIDRHVRMIVPAHKSYLLCLDGHSSRKGTEWIEACAERKCEAIISPANTSHFLQPCDQDVNHGFKGALKHIRDAFCAKALMDTRKVNFQLACGVHAFENITPSDISIAFQKTGVFPFQRHFPEKFRRALDTHKESRNAA